MKERLRPAALTSPCSESRTRGSEPAPQLNRASCAPPIAVAPGKLPIHHSPPASAGIFSIAFRDAKHGVIAGGDYRKEQEAVDNLAVTSDGGVTWTLVKGLSGFRSVVAYVPGTKTLIALGPSGGDYSADDGQTWTPSTVRAFTHLVSFLVNRSVGALEKKELSAGSRLKSD